MHKSQYSYIIFMSVCVVSVVAVVSRPQDLTITGFKVRKSKFPLFDVITEQMNVLYSLYSSCSTQLFS